MLRSRIKRLDEVAWLRAPPSQDTQVEWTPTMRVQALRAVLGNLWRGGRGWLAIRDPFPELEGDAYLEQFGDWFLANAEGWPTWAQDTAFRIGHVIEAMRRRMSPADYRKLVRKSDRDRR
jgi:hypothetical protein